MAYPIKFKLTRKDTGETFAQWDKKNRSQHNDSKNMPFINADGKVGYVNHGDWYMTFEFLSPSDWNLFIATEKTAEGRWDYKQVGF